jgi:phosphatidate cytidylyltransferase
VADTPAKASRKDSLRLRIASAALLIPLTFAAHYAGGAAFTALVAFAVVLMAFEWARMIEGREISPVFWALGGSSLIAMAAAGAGRYEPAYVAAAIGGVLAAILSMRGAMRPLWAGFGALYFIAPSIALIWLRNDVQDGWALTALLYSVVWAADTGGYAGGRLVGGPKLSPIVSPAKTWAGAVGGVLFGAAAAAAAAVVFLKTAPSAVYIFAGACLGLSSILGDMAESAFKRLFGRKDMSGFIPGHGGVLDRLDGMIFATTAMAIVLYVNTFSAPR